MIKSGNQAFAEALGDILTQGKKVSTRNSEVLRVRNLMYTFKSTPLVSTRRTAWKNALREWEWFMSGSNDINTLHKEVHHWWKPWTNIADQVPFNYSTQFRKFVGRNGLFDQVQHLRKGIEADPYSRRNVITTWNPADMADPGCAITNCHGTVIQAFVEPEDNTLHLTMYQRSCDMVLGVPHNWVQYWAFLMWLAHYSGRKVGTFTWVGGDCHIYKDHIDMAKGIIKITAVANAAPQLVYNPTSTDFLADDFELDRPYRPLIKKSLTMTV